MRRWGILLAVIVLLGGCQQNDPGAAQQSDGDWSERLDVEVGMTMDQVNDLNPGIGVVTYDLTERIVGPEAVREREGYTVVVVCPIQWEGENHWLPLGVLPTESVTPEILGRARTGEFRSMLVECGPIEGTE